MALSKTYLKKKYMAGGGSFNSMGSVIGSTEAGLVDALDTGDGLGYQSGATTVAKSTLNMAGAGASIGGPLGAGIGAGVGLITGVLGARSQKAERRKMLDARALQTGRIEKQQQAARIAQDPSLVTGSLTGQYFANGGFIDGDPIKKTKKDNTVVPVGYGLYSGIVNDEGTNNRPTVDQYITNTVGYLKNNMPGISNVYRPEFSHHDSNLKTKFKALSLDPNKLELKDPASITYAANGGRLSSGYMAAGGSLVAQSSDGMEVQGASHAQGGVQLPGAEVEGGETIKDDYVFSKQLGFAQLHKPLMKAKGKIETKPATAERLNALKLIDGKEQTLMLAQEYFKKLHGIQ